MSVNISDGEYKKIVFDILKKTAEYCKKNSIMYYLSYGTLLGAVRHRGFIPWDDDIDIVMPRASYNKFLEKFNERRKDDLRLISVHNTEGYYLAFAKVVDTSLIVREKISGSINIGPYIDIFPLDNLGNSQEEAMKLLSKVGFYCNILKSKNNKWHKNRTIINNIKAMVASFYPLSKKKLIKKINQLSLNYDGKTTKYIGNANMQNYGNREILFADWYRSTTMLEFEGEPFPAPIGYHKILLQLYGDYMQLPPIEEQVSRHSLTIYKVS